MLYCVFLACVGETQLQILGQQLFCYTQAARSRARARVYPQLPGAFFHFCALHQVVATLCNVLLMVWFKRKRSSNNINGCLGIQP